MSVAVYVCILVPPHREPPLGQVGAYASELGSGEGMEICILADWVDGCFFYISASCGRGVWIPGQSWRRCSGGT